jgi:hypothetical protein
MDVWQLVLHSYPLLAKAYISFGKDKTNVLQPRSLQINLCFLINRKEKTINKSKLNEINNQQGARIPIIT